MTTLSERTQTDIRYVIRSKYTIYLHAVYSSAFITSLKVWLSTSATRSIFEVLTILFPRDTVWCPFELLLTLVAFVFSCPTESISNLNVCERTQNNSAENSAEFNKCAGRILRDQSKLVLPLLILITGIRFVSLFCNKGKPLQLIYCSYAAKTKHFHRYGNLILIDGPKLFVCVFVEIFFRGHVLDHLLGQIIIFFWVFT